MSYKSQLEKVRAKSSEAIKLSQVIRSNRDPNRRFFSALFKRQKTYLFWITALMMVQISEIAILAFSHFIFFPPESLDILRVLSSLSFIGILAAFNTRFFDYKKELSAPMSTRMIFCARFLFLAAACISLLLSAYVIFFTNLHLSTPPIYRAVILAGIMGLPFDILNTFVIYNLKHFDVSPIRGKFRIYSCASLITALIFLALGNSAFYLAFILLPRLFFSTYLWRKITGSSFSFLTFHRHAESGLPAYLTAFLKSLAPVFALYAAMETSLFLIFGRLVHFDADLALIVFFCHKIIHVATILGVKSNFIFARHIRFLSFIGEKRSIANVYRALGWITAFYASICLFLLPLIFLKKEVLLWASPIGDYFELTPLFFCATVLLVFGRTFPLVFAAWLLQGIDAKRTLIICSVLSLAVGAMSHYSAGFLVMRYDTVDIFLTFVFLDLLTAAFITRSILKTIMQSKPAQAPAASAEISFADLVKKIIKPAPTGLVRAVVLIDFWKGTSRKIFDEKAVDGLPQFLHAADCYSPVNSGHCFILLERSSVREIEDFVNKLVTCYSAYIASFELAFCGGESVEDLLSRLTAKKGGMTAGLFSVLRGKRRDAVSPSAESVELFRTIKASVTESALPEIANKPMHLLKRNGGWEPSRIADEDARNALYGYFGTLISDESNLGAWPANIKAEGILQLNHKGRAELLVYLEPNERKSLFELRKLAFEHNLADLISFSLPPVQ